VSETAEVRGLPGRLPEGEHLLWQGSPTWKSLAPRTFHGRMIAVYFALLLVWVAAASIRGGASAAQTAVSVLWFTPLAAAGLGLILLLAWLTARTTTYTITSRRLVFSYGIALPMSLNLPFPTVQAAAVKSFADGTADMPLVVAGGQGTPYLMLWPHARPWRIGRPEPALRAIPDGAKVADTLARALAAAAAEQPVQAVAHTAAAADAARGHVPTAAAA
jgi:hypothetical protein